MEVIRPWYTQIAQSVLTITSPTTIWICDTEAQDIRQHKGQEKSLRRFLPEASRLEWVKGGIISNRSEVQGNRQEVFYVLL